MERQQTFDRRSFLSTLSCSLATVAITPLAPTQHLSAGTESQDYHAPASSPRSCWLDVCAPLIIEDAERGLQSEIILTSDTFTGAHGHEDGAEATEYEIYLYDAAGQAVGKEGVARRLTIPAMQTTVIPVRELIGETKSFWGGMKIRLRPRSREVMHTSDLFSSAFVRWQMPASFDNVHANPDPLEWQNTQSYYYSMPFPRLADYACTFSLFNPYDQPSKGEIVLYDQSGQRVKAMRYELKPHASLLFDLNAGSLVSNPRLARAPETSSSKTIQGNGLLAVTNDEGTAKSFGYLFIKQHARERFSVEHPIHQGIFKPRPAAIPFDGEQFKAKNVLYSPLLFRARRLGDITLESRFYLGTGLPLEEALWLYPFATDEKGEVAWSAMKDDRLAEQLAARQLERGIIRLATNQSCALDFTRLTLPPNFSGGIGVAVSPDTSHTLIKVEVRVPEWGAHAFTHFRPGLRSARNYQKPRQRGGLASDYIVSGARIARGKNGIRFDEVIAVMNIDDQGIEGRPVVELFGPRGLVARLPLGTVPPFACRHYLLSELFKGEINYEPLSLRLVDERATLLMSALHLDYERRDIALDHGSDRFSTFLDYGCQ